MNGGKEVDYWVAAFTNTPTADNARRLSVALDSAGSSTPSKTLVKLAMSKHLTEELMWAIVLADNWQARAHVVKHPDCPPNLLRFVAEEPFTQGEISDKVVKAARGRL